MDTVTSLTRMTEIEARDALESIRWPEGATCPRCDSDNIK